MVTLKAHILPHPDLQPPDCRGSRRALAQFNPHVLYLSYPFGGFNDKAVKVAKEGGFHHGGDDHERQSKTGG